MFVLFLSSEILLLMLNARCFNILDIYIFTVVDMERLSLVYRFTKAAHLKVQNIALLWLHSVIDR